jgi:hypothetical protein
MAVTGAARFNIGGAAATSGSTLLAQNVAEYFLVSPGQTVSLIREGGSDVQVNVAFMSR